MNLGSALVIGNEGDVIPGALFALLVGCPEIGGGRVRIGELEPPFGSIDILSISSCSRFCSAAA